MMYLKKSFVLKPREAKKNWYLIDATNKIVGRLASEAASLLRGKQNPQFTPHTDSGDYVIIVNADKVTLTGKKWDQKIYYRHSGYIGGIKQRTAQDQRERCPEKILYHAIKGMLPKNRLGRKQLIKLKIFTGNDHPHTAQRPTVYKLKGKRS